MQSSGGATARSWKAPEFFPPVVQLFAGNDGITFMELPTVRANRIWWMLAADGSPLGRFEVPRTTRVVGGDGRTVWLAEEDADGVPSLVRYAIRRTTTRGQ